MINNNKKIKIVFEFSHVQRDEFGRVEAITFMDSSNSEITLLFNPKNDYSENIEVEILESLYRVLRGRMIKESQVSSIVSLADGKEIITEGLISEANEEEVLTILFRRGKVIPFEGDRGSYQLHKFFDAAQNYVYISENDFEMIFGTKDVKDFVTLGLTYSSIVRGLEDERKKYPSATTAKIRKREIIRGEVLDDKLFDFTILNEVFAGQRRKDSRYNGNFMEVYERVLKFREQERAEKELRPDPVYQISSVQSTSEVRNAGVDSDEKISGHKRGAALREAQRREVREQLQAALLRIQELENLLREKDTQIQIREDVINSLSREYKETKTKYEGLRRIFDGEDENYTAVIYPTS